VNSVPPSSMQLKFVPRMDVTFVTLVFLPSYLICLTGSVLSLFGTRDASGSTIQAAGVVEVEEKEVQVCTKHSHLGNSLII